MRGRSRRRRRGAPRGRRAAASARGRSGDRRRSPEGHIRSGPDLTSCPDGPPAGVPVGSRDSGERTDPASSSVDSSRSRSRERGSRGRCAAPRVACCSLRPWLRRPTPRARSPRPRRTAARWTVAPSSAPSSGATMNSHSCSSAQPPTNSAGPMLRAGLTDRLVIGMPTRWISVSTSPIGMPANATAAIRSVADRTVKTRNDGQHDLGRERARPRVAVRRVVAVAVGAEALDVGVVAGLARRDDRQQQPGRDDRAGDLRRPVARRLRQRDLPARRAGRA